MLNCRNRVIGRNSGDSTHYLETCCLGGTVWWVISSGGGVGCLVGLAGHRARSVGKTISGDLGEDKYTNQGFTDMSPNIRWNATPDPRKNRKTK